MLKIDFAKIFCHVFNNFRSKFQLVSFFERCPTDVGNFLPPKFAWKMHLTCEDLKLCTDQFAYCTDNPLAGRRCGYRPAPPYPHIGGADSGRSAPRATGFFGDFNEHIAEIAFAVSDSSVLNISCLVINNTLVYLLGTDHVNPKCQQEVSKIINLVKPNTVIVELCKYRACRCPSHRNSIFQNPAQFSFR